MHHLVKGYFIVLGASRDQKQSILTAKNIGFKTIVFDKNDSAYCKSLADIFFNISSSDWKKIIKRIRKYKNLIRGVIAQGSDIPYSVSKIEKYLKIKGRVPLRSSKICSNKLLMKKFFIENNIPTPKRFLNIKKINKEEYPVIVKPYNLSGSKGVYICSNKKELINNINLTKNFSNKIVLEKFYKGPQLSTESLIINKKVYTFGYAERNYNDTKFFYPNILENGGIQKSLKLLKYKKKIKNYIKKISQSLSISNGVIKSDIIIKDKKIFFIEVALRLSGGDFSETLIPKSTGINFIKCAIKNAAGLKINSNELKELPINKQQYFANRYFFTKKDLIIKKIIIPKSLKIKDWLHKIQFTKTKNIKKTQSHSDRFGVFIVSARTIKNLESRINLVYKRIKF